MVSTDDMVKLHYEGVRCVTHGNYGVAIVFLMQSCCCRLFLSIQGLTLVINLVWSTQDVILVLCVQFVVLLGS